MGICGLTRRCLKRLVVLVGPRCFDEPEVGVAVPLKAGQHGHGLVVLDQFIFARLVGVAQRLGQLDVDGVRLGEAVLVRGRGGCTGLGLEELFGAAGQRLVRRSPVLFLLGLVPAGQESLEVAFQERIEVVVRVELVDVADAGQSRAPRATSSLSDEHSGQLQVRRADHGEGVGQPPLPLLLAVLDASFAPLKPLPASCEGCGPCRRPGSGCGPWRSGRRLR